MTGPYEFREMMRDHEDTKREYRELAAKYEALRAQLAESEAACAGYRAALEKIAKGATTPKDASPDFFAAACLAAGASYVQTARQALQSNPGKAVGDVIAAARELVAADHLREGRQFEQPKTGTPTGSQRKTARLHIACTSARPTIALAAEGMKLIRDYYERKKAEWIEAVTKEYSAEYARKHFRDYEIGMAGFGELLVQWEEMA